MNVAFPDIYHIKNYHLKFNFNREKRIPKYLHTIVSLQQKARTMFICYKLYDKYQELTCQQCDNSGQSAFAWTLLWKYLGYEINYDSFKRITHASCSIKIITGPNFLWFLWIFLIRNYTEWWKQNELFFQQYCLTSSTCRRTRVRYRFEYCSPLSFILNLRCGREQLKKAASVADPVPFWTLDSGRVFSGSRISDHGSQTHIFESLEIIFGVKSTTIICELARFLYMFKNNLVFSILWYLWLQKVGQQIFFPLLFLAVVVSWIRDPGWIKIRIQVKNPESATLESNKILSTTV